MPDKKCSTCGTSNCGKFGNGDIVSCGQWSEIPVEDYENKNQACREGQKRIKKCQEILDKDIYFGSKCEISLIGGSVDSPVSLVRIEGILHISKLQTIYKILRDTE
jgi:hypothetical protein